MESQGLIVKENKLLDASALACDMLVAYSVIFPYIILLVKISVGLILSTKTNPWVLFHALLRKHEHPLQ